MNSQTILEVLRTFLTVLGGGSALWGIYDLLLSDGGAQSSAGTKKLIGGIAFAAIAYLILTMAMSDIKKAEASAGLTIFVNPGIQAEYHIAQSNEM